MSTKKTIRSYLIKAYYYFNLLILFNCNSFILQSIVKSVIEINKDYPNEQYLKLYKLRYVNKKTQNQISFELNISQNEVAKRLIELGNLIKLYINQAI